MHMSNWGVKGHDVMMDATYSSICIWKEQDIDDANVAEC